MWWLFVFVYFSSATASVPCEDCKETEPPLKLENVLLPGYDKLKPPTEKGSPVKVQIKISILNIRSVDETKQEIQTDIFFHQYWYDPRITLPKSYNETKIVLDNRWRNKIWTPDTYFKNSIDGNLHNIIIPYTYLVLHDDSKLFLAARLGLTLNCGMNLAHFPHDVQECDVKLMSLTHPIEKMVLDWKQFHITKNIFLAQFYVSSYSSKACNSTYDIGTYSCLVGKMKLSRRLGYYLMNNFVPSILIVLMSFVTFWIPATAYPARVTLGVTSLLTIVTQQYKTITFSVSYVIAMNVWMLGCIAFVFFSLLEYALVITTLDKQTNKGMVLFQPVNQEREKRLWNLPSISEVSHVKIDKISRVLFPSLFIINSVIYWLVYARP